MSATVEQSTDAPVAAAPPAPLHPGRRLTGSMRDLLANQLGFIASTRATGDVVRVRVGPPGGFEVHVLHTVEGAEKMLSAKTWHNFRKDNRYYDEIRQVFGDGILTAQDEDWTRQKRFVQPVFTRARVDGYLAGMLTEIESLAEDWRHTVGAVDLGAAMQRLTLRIVGTALFGDQLDQLETTVAREFPRASSGILGRVALPVPVPLSWPLPVNRRLRSAQQALYAVCDEIIERRRSSGERADDLVSLLLDARDGSDTLTDREVRDQVLIFLLAGHETTSSSLTFALHLLGRHPDIQERVREEVGRVLGDARPTAGQIHSALPYTTAVLKEAMRLYPAAPFTGRRAAEAITVGGYRVPDGSDTVISVWSIHHDPDLWPDPMRFDPDRFTPEREKARSRYAWMPFGAGPRACIGQHFSMLESVATLAVLVRDFDLVAPRGAGDPKVDSAITLYPVEAVRSIVTPR